MKTHGTENMACLQFWEKKRFQIRFEWVQGGFLSERKWKVIPCWWTEIRKGAGTNSGESGARNLESESITSGAADLSWPVNVCQLLLFLKVGFGICQSFSLCYASVCCSDNAITLRAFRAECCLWRSAWLKLSGDWQPGINPLCVRVLSTHTRIHAIRFHTSVRKTNS